MSEPVGQSTRTEPSGDRGRSVWTWLLPALMFVVGAALSAALFALGDTDETVAAAPTVDPTADAADGERPSGEPEVVVRIPAACVEAAELAATVTSALGDVAYAAGSLDARRLQESLDVVQQIRPEVESASRECRDLARDARVVTPEQTGPPTATGSPSATPAG